MRLPLFFLLLLLCGCQPQHPVVVNGSGQAIAFVGRWFPTPGNCRTTIAQGNSLSIRVHGAGALDLRAFTPTAAEHDAVIAVRVDQGIFRRFKIPLSNKPVTIRVATFRRTDHLVQVVAAGIYESAPVWKSGSGISICGAVIDRGTFYPVHLSGKRVLFVGDSITAGIYVLKRPEDKGSLPDNAAAEQGYAFLTAQRLNMQAIFAAYGYAGLLVPGNGGVPDAQHFVVAYRNSLPIQSDHADLIVINLGTNDNRLLIRDNIIQEKQRFIRAYIDLIHSLHTMNPGSQIVILRPFTVNSTLSNTLPMISQLSGVTLIETSNWHISTVDQVHPDSHGSEMVADLLSLRLRQMVKQ
ncbi:GDSL-type esterase/lipase family protein [Deinococcus sp. KNUC1210]|uniref:GDSL-type esterase/lipase family protein n=1 Tax=Deinococcus sp. KNUC1210 TaxID=2917691 RepID=UPI001EF08920|nr:GDSL-type esterase/lipase family protein [Deinococcus sp. KNUC1210]ULH15978.1 GDSL-type esterase/lipase family protein [Deinococcus sp. KNUC1210]